MKEMNISHRDSVLTCIVSNNSENSGEPAQMHRLAREFAAHIDRLWTSDMDVDEDSEQSLDLNQHGYVYWPRSSYAGMTGNKLLGSAVAQWLSA